MQSYYSNCDSTGKMGKLSLFCFLEGKNPNQNKNQQAWDGADTWISVFAQKHIVYGNQWIGRKVWDN